MEENVNVPGVEKEIKDLRFELVVVTRKLDVVVEYLGMIAVALEGIKGAILNREVSK
jgi:hypothetical protein